MFTNNTNLFLRKHDQMDHIQEILDKWCRISGAKFNIEKIEIILLRSRKHQNRVLTT